MARHVSSPRLLSWWQRLAIAVPVLLLAGVVTFALIQRDGTQPPSDADIAGAPVSPTTPSPTSGSTEVGADSDPATAQATDEDAPTDEQTGDPDQREQEPSHDPVTPEQDSDSDEAGPDDSGTESPETIDPESDDETEGANGPDDSDDETEPTTPPDDDDNPDTDPTEPPDDSDQTDTVTMGEALAACRREIGAGNVNRAVRTCADALVGTPISQLQSNVDDVVEDLGCLVRLLCKE